MQLEPLWVALIALCAVALIAIAGGHISVRHGASSARLNLKSILRALRGERRTCTRLPPPEPERRKPPGD